MRPMYLACAFGDKSSLRKIIKTYPLKVLECKDDFGRTPLHVCILKNQVECATLLMKAGVYVDDNDSAGQTLLHIAVHKGFHRCIKLLLAYGASWKQIDFFGVSSLHMAAIQRNIKCLTTILKVLKRGEVDIQDSTKKTPLHWAAAYSSVDNLKSLLSKGANIRIPDDDGKIPLHWAAMNSNSKAIECVKILLKKNKNISNWQDYGGRSALHLAVATGTSEVVHFLAAREDCNIDILDNAFCTPLHWAAKRGLSEKVNILLNKGASFTSADGNGATPLHYATYYNHAKTMEVFLSRNYIHDEADSLGRNAFIWAAAKKAENTLKVMAAHGANLTYSDYDGSTALHVAAMHGHESTVQLLVNFGTPVDIADNRKMTPLLIACAFGRAKSTMVLLDFGADIHCKDVNDCSVLHWCALGGHAYLSQLLLKRGALCNARDVFGRVPLHYTSVLADYINCTSVLVESGANPNAIDFEGKSPLHCAIINDRPGVTRLLCDYDANVNAMVLLEDWTTPLDLAMLKKNSKIISSLESKEALRGHEIKELAATTIQFWYRNIKSWRKCCCSSVASFKSSRSELKAYTEKVLDLSSLLSQDIINVLLERNVCDNFLSKTSLVQKRFYANAQSPGCNVRCYSLKPDAVCSNEDVSYTNAKEDRAAVVIQRCWKRYSMKRNFSRIRRQIQMCFQAEEQRMIAEKLWQSKLNEFFDLYQ